jgi:RNA polymerase sigma factor (sigma-70 family)
MANMRRLWADRVVLLAGQLAGTLDDTARAHARGELWLLLSAVLARFARAQVHTLGPLSREDLEDLVATKALDLLRRIEGGSLVLGRESDGDVSGFIARTSRNAVIDHLRRERTRRGGSDDPVESIDVAELAIDPARDEDAPSHRVELAELTCALETCVEALAPRARRIWIFRTFLEMSSRDIAAHPDIRLTPAHVDVIVSRSRSALRACLEHAGFDASHLSVAGMARLWDRFVRVGPEDGDVS